MANISFAPPQLTDELITPDPMVENQYGMSVYQGPGIRAQTMSPASINVAMDPWMTNYQANPLYQFAMQGAGIGGLQHKMSKIASGLQSAFGQNLQYANQALNLAFDPRSALFNQRQQDLVDATRAAEAARGIAMSPYGAGIEADAIGRFYNDWQNEQVARMAQGASAATALQGMWAQAQQAAAGIYNDEVKNRLQQFGIRGDLMSKALDEILQATRIQADLAATQFSALAGTQRSGGGGGGGVSGGGLGMDPGSSGGSAYGGGMGGAVGQALAGGGG
ncbi:MAG: hypothetical protein C5B60_01470 [Chloroflexi bacterium]|nr:MAG: hypothetical protein C5B60_01470 [Chloroflexota bacterium]